MDIEQLKTRVLGRQGKYAVSLLLVLVVGAAGLLGMRASQADTVQLPAEAESGVVTGNAKIVADNAASGKASVLFGSGTATSAACANGVKPPTGVSQTMSLGFCDDFDGTTVDSAKWSFRSSAEAVQSDNPFGTANPGNKQLEFNQPANCTLSDGVLSMTAKPGNVTVKGKTYNWTSCMLDTAPSYKFRYGYIEERAQFPDKKGFWPALWTWAAPGVTTCGASNCETDAYEYYSDNKTKLYLTQHNGAKHSCDYDLPFDPSTAMHTYGVDIQASGTKWYIDGNKVCETTITSAGETNILVDNFVFADIPPDAGSIGVKRIDYVRAWK